MLDNVQFLHPPYDNFNGTLLQWNCCDIHQSEQHIYFKACRIHAVILLLDEKTGMVILTFKTFCFFCLHEKMKLYIIYESFVICARLQLMYCVLFKPFYFNFKCMFRLNSHSFMFNLGQDDLLILLFKKKLQTQKDVKK